MIYFFYNLLLPLLYLLLKTASLFSESLRKNLDIRKARAVIDTESRQYTTASHVFWLHAASVGEYDAARAFAVRLKKKFPQSYLAFSIYSVSAYNQRQNDPLQDAFFALPFDFKKRTARLVEQLRPDAVFYAKYDVWPNLAREVYRRNIPQYLICASLPAESARQKGLSAAFFRAVYSQLNAIYTVHDEHAGRFRQLGVRAKTGGDTRFDAIADKLADRPSEIEKIEHFIKINKQEGKPFLVAGSTYPASEKFLARFLSRHPEYSFIIAPHHVQSEKIENLQSLLHSRGIDHCLYTDPEYTGRGLVLNTTGLLSFLYRDADYIYVGGGWQGSVHTVTEPAVFGRPVICGPHMHNSLEAEELAESNLLFIMKSESAESLAEEIDRIEAAGYQQLRDKIKQFFNERAGASEKTLRLLEKEPSFQSIEK